MKSVKILTAAVLGACLLSVPVFAAPALLPIVQFSAQQTTPQPTIPQGRPVVPEHAPLPTSLVTQAGVQTTATRSLDIYVDGTLAASGIGTHANITLTLDGRGDHTITASTSGTNTPVYTGSYASTVTGQVIHLTTDGNDNVALY